MDPHSVAMVAVHAPGLREATADGQLEALRMLTDRRDEFGEHRVHIANRLNDSSTNWSPDIANETCPPYSKRQSSPPRVPATSPGRLIRRRAAEEITDLVAVDAKLKKIKAELESAVIERGSTLLDVHGIGPAGAARILADVGDVARFADRSGCASWTPPHASKHRRTSRSGTGCPAQATAG